MSDTELNLTPVPADELEREQLIETLVVQGEDDGHSWAITDKGAAAWAVRKVAQARAAMEENQRIAEAEMQRIKTWLERENAGLERQVGFFTFHLERFHRELIKQDPKAKTIKLPHGEISLRTQQPEMVYDEAALVVWLKENRPDMVRVKEEPNKVELKKVLDFRPASEIPDGQLVAVDKETGEFIEGIKATERPAAFSVKTDN